MFVLSRLHLHMYAIAAVGWQYCVIHQLKDML